MVVDAGRGPWQLYHAVHGYAVDKLMHFCAVNMPVLCTRRWKCYKTWRCVFGMNMNGH